MNRQVIAIDGPSASGKGTIAAQVAQQLGWQYLDSGALYRLSALYAQQNNVSWQDETALCALIADLPVHFDNQKIILNDIDVSHAIRQEKIGSGASQIAALPAVRDALLQRQRDFSADNSLVADGRDMASVVFPDACLKVFLTADAPVRAQRRAKQLGLPENGAEYIAILGDIEARDARDKQRTVAPLKPVADAHILDTSSMSIAEAVAQVLAWYRAVV